MFATIKHDEHLLAREEGDQARDWIVRTHRNSQHGCQRTWHEARVRQWRQVNEASAVPVCRNDLGGHGERYRGLADPPWPDDCDDAALGKLVHDRLDGVLAAEDPC